MFLIRRALSLGLALALAACVAPPSVADIVPEAIAAPVADGAPQDPAQLAVGSGQPVFIEFYTDW